MMPLHYVRACHSRSKRFWNYEIKCRRAANYGLGSVAPGVESPWPWHSVALAPQSRAVAGVPRCVDCARELYIYAPERPTGAWPCTGTMCSTHAHAGSRTRVTSMGGLSDAATLCPRMSFTKQKNLLCCN